MLMLAQLPPPVHGAAVMSRLVADSVVLNAAFDLLVEPIPGADRLEDLRRFSLSKAWRGLKFLAIVGRRLCGSRRPDLVYLTFSPRGFALARDLLVVALCRLVRIPHVLHLHGRGLDAAVCRRRALRALVRLVLADAYAVVLDERLFADVSRFVPRARVKIVANGIADPLAEKRGTIAANSPLDRPPVVLFVSNMLREKGPLILLEALAAVAKQKVPFHAVFAGAWRGDLTEGEFDTAVHRLGLDGVVLHRGAVYGDSKWALFRTADLFVFPSFYANEAMPLVLLEAMAFGLPVVSTDVAAIPSVVRNNETGLVVRPADADVLAQAIASLLANRERRHRMGKAARESFERRYTRSHFEQGLAAALKEVHEAANVAKRPSSRERGADAVNWRRRTRVRALHPPPERVSTERDLRN
jgi:glycosyltransferase involved in cell wall biosynthesis